MKRAEITAAKIATRTEITQVLEQLRAVARIPDRIMAADQKAAADFKLLLEVASKKKRCSYQYGSLEILTRRLASLREWHRCASGIAKLHDYKRGQNKSVATLLSFPENRRIEVRAILVAEEGRHTASERSASIAYCEMVS